MTDPLTPLDAALAATEAAPEDDAARLRFYDRLADAELFVMLDAEPQGDTVTPRIFDLGEARVVVAFDLEDRLSQFAGGAVPYLAISGRALAGMLTAEGLTLGLNLEVAPASILLPPEALGWLVQTLGAGPAEAEARPERLSAPTGLPQDLLTALDAKLAATGGLARKAYLAAVTYEGGAQGHLLGVTGAVPGAEPALARAINEALVFSGLEAGALDVTFVPDDDPLAAELARVALRFDLPQPEAARTEVLREAPGSNPDKPPKLR